MSQSQVKATARVSISLDITVTGSWGPDCKTEQVYRQARREALEQLERDLKSVHHRYKLVGEPRVVAIIMEEPS